MTRDRCRRYFVEQLVKYREVEFYWSDGRLVSRCVHVRLHRPIPLRAEFIGRYCYPFPSGRFLSDLNDAIARINAAHVRHAAPAVA